MAPPPDQPAGVAPAAPDTPIEETQPDLVQPGEEEISPEGEPPEQALAETDTTADAVTNGVAAPVSTSDEILIRLTSDWGSAFSGQDVEFTFTLRNINPPADNNTNDLRDLEFSTRLPANLVVNGATADRGGDPTVDTNTVTYSLKQLRPGESIEIVIPTTIRDGVLPGTILIAQGQVEFDDITQPINSNIVTVLIVESALQQPTIAVATSAPPITAAQPYPGPTGTQAATDTPAPTDTSAPVPTDTSAPGSSPVAATATSAATAGGTPDTDVAPPADSDSAAPLPATSTGVPIAGIVLLGMTLFVRTVRLKRERERL